MKRFVLVIGWFLVLCGMGIWGGDVQAETYPARPIQLVIPIPAGGGGDITGRVLADELGKHLGVQVIAVNKPGAGATLGIDAVANSKKDGYTIGYSSGASMVYARILNPESIHYDPIRDFEFLGMHVVFPLTIAVQESSPYKTFGEFIEYAKKNPGQIRVSTTGIGSPPHFNLEMIQSMTGVQLTHIPFKGGESVITAVLGGHVEATCDSLGKIMPQMEAGKMRVLVTSGKFTKYPNIPTMTELGYKQDLLSGWFGLCAPAGIPEDVKKTLVAAIEKAARSPESRAVIEKVEGYMVDYKGPAAFKKQVIDENEKAREIAAKVGMQK
jgi:tripartite-type tricarboxylate transporter receptor subunit TctC